MDLVNDLLEALAPYDVTAASWLRLRERLPEAPMAVAVDELDRALNSYVYEQIQHLRLRNGSVEIDNEIAQLPAARLTDILVTVGRLSARDLVDNLVVYAAHIAAGTSYGPAVWHEAVLVVNAAKIINNEKEVSRR